MATGGTVSATGTVTGGNVDTGGTVSATSTITGGNLATGGTASAGGNVTGANILTGGVVSATGNITGANVNTAQVYGASTLTLAAGTGNLNLNTTGNIVLANTIINGVAEPLQNQDAATKLYVDTAVTTGITIHESVYAATNTTLATATGGTITYTQPNGVSNGIGAYIQTTGTFTTIDTANVNTVGTRILVKNEANAVFNGIYVYSNATAITRSSDADQYGANSTQEISYNDYFFTTNGNVNAGTAFVVNEPTGTITFGTSNIGFGVFSQAVTYTANTAAGISITGTIISAKVDENTTAFDGGGNISVKAGANLTTPNIGAATGTSLSTTGTITGGNLATGGTISGTGTITGGNVDTGGTVSATGTATAGNLATGGTVSATGTATAGNLATGGTISGTGTITGGNIDTGGFVTATGNVTGGNIYTGGLVSSTGTVTGGNLATGGTVSATGTATVGNLATGGTVSATGTVTGGNIATGGTISATGTATVGNVNTAGNVSASGNVTGAYILGNGFYLGGVANSESAGKIVNGTSNVNIPITDGNVTIGIGGTGDVVVIATTGEYVTGLLSVTGTITGGNVNTGGAVSATGTVTGGNLATGGTVSATGTATVGNLATGGTVSATGTITGGNLATGGTISGTGTITGGNIDTGGTISATGTATVGNLVTGGTVSATSTITGGNLSTGGTATVTGTITGGNLATGGTVSATGDITGGNLATGGTVSSTGTVTGGNLATGGTASATGTVTGGNLATGGTVSATGTVTGGNVDTAGTISATGTVTGGNVVTGGIVSAIGTVTGGNIATGGTVSATGDISSSGNASATGNVTGSNILTAGYMSATGNVYAANFVGNVSGNISAPGANTQVIFNNNGIAYATSGFTFDYTSNTVTVGANVNAVSFNGNVYGTTVSASGNVETGGYVSAIGNVRAGNIHALQQLSGANIFAENSMGANGTVTAGTTLITNLGGIDLGNLAVGSLFLNYSGNDVNTGIYDAAGNVVFLVDAGTSTASFGSATQIVGSLVSFNTPSAITVPVGNTGQRPGTASTGQFRFNSSTNSLEIYDNSQWTSVGVPAFTLITDQQFNGDGSTVVFTLSANATTAGTIVSINGVQQIPVTAYAVSNTTLTFTEAPEVGDQIDVRVLTTTTTVTSISNSSGNAVVAVSDTSATTTITGDLLVTGNATITGNIAANQITNGSSAVQIPTPNGNVVIDVNGVDNVLTVGQSLMTYLGNISATGDVTAQNVNSLSDATLKANVTPIDNAGTVVDALNGVGYDWKDGSGHAYGMIAQAVEEILPEAVNTNDDGIKSINYSMVIPFLVETVKELRQDIAEIRSQLKK